MSKLFGNKKSLQKMGYTLFFVTMFGFFWFLTLPMNAIGHRISREIAKATYNTWSLDFQDISTYLVSGVKLKQVKFTNVASDNKLEVALDSLKIRLQLLPLLFFKVVFKFEGKIGYGLLTGKISLGAKSEMLTSFKIKSLRLDSMPALQALTKLAIGGELFADGNLALKEGFKNSTGKLNFSLYNAKVLAGVINNFKIPEASLGKFDILISLHNGVAKIENFQQKGGQVQVKCGGKMDVYDNLMFSKLEICTQAKADNDFLSKNPMLSTLLQLAELNVKKDLTGFFHLPVVGNLKDPKISFTLCSISK